MTIFVPARVVWLRGEFRLREQAEGSPTRGRLSGRSVRILGAKDRRRKPRVERSSGEARTQANSLGKFARNPCGRRTLIDTRRVRGSKTK